MIAMMAVCVIISFHRKGFAWQNKNVMLESMVWFNDSWFVFHDFSWSFHESYFGRKHISRIIEWIEQTIMVFKPANKYRNIRQCHDFKSILFDCNWTRTYNHLVPKQTIQRFCQTGQITELCCEYLSARCIWLYLLMSRTRFRVNPHSIVAWMSKNPLLEAGAKSEVKWLQLDSNPEPLSS